MSVRQVKQKNPCTELYLFQNNRVNACLYFFVIPVQIQPPSLYTDFVAQLHSLPIHLPNVCYSFGLFKFDYDRKQSFRSKDAMIISKSSPLAIKHVSDAPFFPSYSIRMKKSYVLYITSIILISK